MGNRTSTISESQVNSDIIRAVVINDYQEVRRWISLGGNVNQIYSSGFTLLMYAVYNGCEETVHELVTSGANIEQRNEEGMSIFMIATYSGHIEIVKYLLDAGANPSTVDHYHTTALMLASYNGHVDIVKLLINLDVDTLFRDRENNTAYDMARTDEIKQILQPIMNWQRRKSWLIFLNLRNNNHIYPSYQSLNNKIMTSCVLNNSDLTRYLSDFL